MKKSLLAIVLVFCVVIAASVTYATEEILDFSANNWINPVGGTMKTDTEWNYMSRAYETRHQKRHTGVDIEAALDSPVYAIADGVVYHIARKDSTTKNMSVIYIRHETSNQNVFTAVYGHCRAVKSLNEGDVVSAGKHIGNIVRYGSPDHLHFGINEKVSIEESGWGQLGLDVVDEYWLGWRNPSDFFSSNTPHSVISETDMVFDDIEYIYYSFFPHRYGSYTSSRGYYYRYYPNSLFLIESEGSLWCQDHSESFYIGHISDWWNSPYRNEL